MIRRRGPVDLAPRPPHEGEVASVYVHAPFCARRCFYCDFAVQVRRTGDLHGWIRALGEELRVLEREGTFRLADRLRTLYVGGGTPSLLGPEAMERLARLLGSRRLGGDALEWTAEANPESFTPRVAEAWRRAGVGRVSLGVQSFQESALRWMGRLHGPGGALDAVETARRAGFGEIGVDLIFGLPARLGRDWSADLERTLALDVTHVSLYGLTVEEGTPLGRSVAAGRERVADESRYREAYLEASERLSAGGYVHYEVSNLARPGSESAHNRVYWEGGAYLGLGNSAHSYRHPLRRWNLASWDAYRQEVGRARPPVAGSEILDAAAERLERLWLALRTRRGLVVGEAGGAVRRLLRSWERAGLAEVADDVVRLTPEGWLVMDRLVVELDDALDATPPAEAAGPAA